jgi:hypothetical protein
MIYSGRLFTDWLSLKNRAQLGNANVVGQSSVTFSAAGEHDYGRFGQPATFLAER